MSDSGFLLLLLAVGALMVWAAITWVHFLADAHGPIDKDGLVGVRGWLTVLVGGLVAWGPLISLGRMYQEISEAEVLYPALKALSIWQSYTLVMWTLVFALLSWQMHVGWRMCRERSPRVISYLKKYLIWSPIASLAAGLPNVFVLDQDYPFAEIFGGSIGLAFVNGIWFWYVSTSKRVARTYNLSQVANMNRFVQEPSLDTSRGIESWAADKPSKADAHSDNQSPLAQPTNLTEFRSVADLQGRTGSSVDEKISQRRLERSLGLGGVPDEALYSRCLTECDSDYLRATAMYQRIKAGLSAK